MDCYDNMWVAIFSCVHSCKLKSNLQPNINDTLMHYLEASTAWLYIARSACTDGFLPTL